MQETINNLRKKLMNNEDMLIKKDKDLDKLLEIQRERQELEKKLEVITWSAIICLLN